jgi:hypothetical protein
MSEPANTDTLLADLRAQGWTVAAHYDYRQDGDLMSYWLFTHLDGRWAEGSDTTNIAALEAVLGKVAAERPKTLKDEILELSVSPRAEELSLPVTQDPLDRVVGQKPRDLMEALDACAQLVAHTTPFETILAALPQTWAMLDQWNKRHGLKVVQFDTDLLQAAYQDQLDAVKRVVSDLSPLSVEEVDYLVEHAGTPHELVRAAAKRQLDKIRKGG